MGYLLRYSWVSLVAQLVKTPPIMSRTWVQSLSWEDPLKKGKAIHSSILAWRIPCIVRGLAKSPTRLSDFHFHLWKYLYERHFFFSFIFISWRLITLQYCSGLCHTLTWISHGFTCVPHSDPPSHLPLCPIPMSGTLRRQEHSRSGLPGWSMPNGAVSWKPSQPVCSVAWPCLFNVVHVGLLWEGLFPLLYLAETAVPWVASVLSLEQRKYCSACQLLNFIFKSYFSQNWISWPSLVTADPSHMGIGRRWVTWASFSGKYIFFIGLISRDNTSFWGCLSLKIFFMASLNPLFSFLALF